jgi:hypothetical protein
VHEHYRKISGGLAAFNMAIILGIVATSTESSLLITALIFSSIGLPVSLSAWLFNQYDSAQSGHGLWMALTTIGALAGLIGVVLLISVKSVLAAFIFLVCSVLCSVVVYKSMLKALEFAKITKNVS